MRLARIVLTIGAAGALTLGGVVPVASADSSSDGITMQDRCDPVSFARAGIPCAPTGEHVTFSRLIRDLVDDPAGVLREQESTGWRFHDDAVTLRAGHSLVVRNTGGEVHTFSRVPSFGGGCVPDLNGIFTLSPDGRCADAAARAVAAAAARIPPSAPAPPFLDAVFTPVFPGQTVTLSFPTAGTFRFECMVHPWMRATVTVQ